MLQFEQIDSLDTKASIVLGAASLLSGMIGATQVSPVPGMLQIGGCVAIVAMIGLAIAIVLFIATMITALVALKVRSYEFPVMMDAEEISYYTSLGPEEARRQILSNYVSSASSNAQKLARKAKFVRIALVLLGIEVTYLILAVSIAPSFVSALRP